jgi:hypothetical protein
VLGLAHLIWVAQLGSEQPLAIGPQRDHPLALGEDQAPERPPWSCSAWPRDHRKGLLADRLVGDDIVRSVEEALVDLLARHETVDLGYVGALDLDGFELLVLDDQVLPLGDLVAAALVLGVDGLAGFLVDELLTQPVAGGLVDLPECDALCRRAGGMQCDRSPSSKGAW